MIRRGADSSVRDLTVAALLTGCLTAFIVIDSQAGLVTQRLLGLIAWVILAVLMYSETPHVRAQVAIVVVFATAVEYIFSPLLEVYVYRFHNLPAYVPPSHGLVYLCALLLGRNALARRYGTPLVASAVLIGGVMALWGVLGADRLDVLGLFWYACLLAFLRWGRSRMLYVGAFVIVTHIELLGTRLGTWTWATHDPTGWVPIGNPPSVAAGGYGWFDLAAVFGAPAVLHAAARGRRRIAAWRQHQRPSRFPLPHRFRGADDGVEPWSALKPAVNLFGDQRFSRKPIGQSWLVRAGNALRAGTVAMMPCGDDETRGDSPPPSDC